MASALVPNGDNAFLLPLQTPADVDRSIELEEENIQRAQQRILWLKTHRNALSPICRIPVELLGEIFVTLANSQIAGYRRSTGPLSRPHWTVVTAVCRHWRDISLRTPRMWSYIHLRSRDDDGVFSTFISRSGRTPLTIIEGAYLRSNSISQPAQTLQMQKLKMILAEFRRIQKLSLVLGKNLIKLSEETPYSFDAPYLHTLNVLVTLTAARTRMSFPTLADASWPKLEDLHCTFASFALVQALTRCSLTQLKVEYLHTPQPAISWINLLKDLPRLEELTITAGIADPSVPVNDIPRPTRTVTLQQLKCVYLRDSGTGVGSADLLNNLVIPAGARRGLHTSRSTDEELRFILSACAAKSRGQGIIGGVSRPVRVLCIETTMVGCSFRLFTGDIRVSEEIENGRGVPCVDDRIIADEALFLEGPQDLAIKLLFSIYPVQQLQGLRLELADVEATDIWQTISALPSLHEMFFTQADECIVAFLQLFPQAASSFPKLKRLIFRGVAWSQPHASLRKRRARTGSLLPGLVRAVEVRTERGQGLEQLELASSYNIGRRYRCREDLERLAELVETFKYSLGDRSYDQTQCDTCSEDSGDEVDSMSGGSDEDMDEGDEER